MWIKALVCPLKTDNESLIAALALSGDSSAANERAIVDRADPNTPDHQPGKFAKTWTTTAFLCQT